MNLENIVALLHTLIKQGDYTDESKIFDKRYTNKQITEIIYFLLNYMEERYWGYQEEKLPQIINEIYKPIFHECFFDLIAEYDSFDEIINEAIGYRKKPIKSD